VSLKEILRRTGSSTALTLARECIPISMHNVFIVKRYSGFIVQSLLKEEVSIVAENVALKDLHKTGLIDAISYKSSY